jgi:hypothetical protein
VAVDISDVSRSVSQQIAKRIESRFTGKINLVCEVNMCNGGITDAHITETERTKVKGRGK